LPGLYFKDECGNPTGSFKARGLAMAVSRAKELGIDRVIIPTAGNAGSAVAAYAARAGMKCKVIMPRDVPAPFLVDAAYHGAETELVDGTIKDCGLRAAELSKSEGWFSMATLKEPYRIEGKKTMGYELAEQFCYSLPEIIIYPTGGGTGLIGMWKAFDEMERMGQPPSPHGGSPGRRLCADPARLGTRPGSRRRICQPVERSGRTARAERGG
jgi:threonine synthase